MCEQLAAQHKNVTLMDAKTVLQKLKANEPVPLTEYDLVILASAVWAANLPPTMANLLKKLDLTGKDCVGIMNSASGGRYTPAMRRAIITAGGSCQGLYDVRKGALPDILELNKA